MATKRNPKRRRNIGAETKKERSEVDGLAAIGWSALAATVTVTITYYVMREIYVDEVIEQCTQILRPSQATMPSPLQLERHARAILSGTG